MIQIEHVKFRYHNDKPYVIDLPKLIFERGKTVLLIGKSGSGKSTFINLLSGLLVPSEGKIIINNACINELKAGQRNQFRANHIGLISQQFNLIPYLSVFENIVLANSFQNRSNKVMHEEVLNFMKGLNLNANLLHAKASELSVGQQQRVAIIRAIFNKPKLVLADEPTSALDHQAKVDFIRILTDLVHQFNMTLIFISHDMALKKHFPTIIEMEKINAV